MSARPVSTVGVATVAVLLAACAGPQTGAPGTGAGGSGGTSAGAPVMKDPSSYAQNTPGATFPYPQGHASAYCTFPAYNTDKVAAAYTNWKQKFFDGTKIIRPENGNDTVSEGIGYGMLIGVYMNDQPMFNALWTFAQSKPDGKGLMTWCVPNGSGSCSGGGSATDADEDMAYALLMANKQWPGGSYLADATALIGNIMADEISGGVVEGGDGFNNANQIDPSYLAPSYYRAFAAATGNSAWMTVLDTSYQILAAASGTDGLVPNWVNPAGVGTSVHGNDDLYFGYDACRVPFRIAIDYCENGEPRAKTYADLIATFYGMKAPAALSTLVDGYTTTGGKPPAPSALGSNPAGMAFFGPAAVASTVGGHDAFVSIGYPGLVNETTGGAMTLSGVFTYFHASWGVLSLLELSGNFWDMTQ